MMAKLRLLLIGETADLLAVECDRPGVGGVQCAEQMQERALTRTRRPDDRDELPTSEAQVDFVECAHRLTANPVLADHIAEFDGQHRGPTPFAIRRCESLLSGISSLLL